MFKFDQHKLKEEIEAWPKICRIHVAQWQGGTVGGKEICGSNLVQRLNILPKRFNHKNNMRAMGVVKWSECSPSTSMIRVRFLLKLKKSVKLLKRTKINKKRQGLYSFSKE